MPEREVVDTMTIRRVANGWVILPGGGGVNDFTHIAATPDELARHVGLWASAQIGPPVKRTT